MGLNHGSNPARGVGDAQRVIPPARGDTARMRLLPVLLLPFLLCACGAEPASVPTWRGEGHLVEITVHDLHCEGCEKTVEDEIALVEGVDSVTADHVTNLVLVTLEAQAERVATLPGIRDAVHEAGMQVVGEDELE